MSNRDFLERAPDDLEQYLIEQARCDRPAAGVRQRAVVLVSMATSTASAGLAATSVASGSSGVSAAPWIIAAKWAAIGVASGVVTIGAAEGVRYRQSSHLPTPPAVVVPVTAQQPIMLERKSSADGPSAPSLAAPAATVAANPGATLARPTG